MASQGQWKPNLPGFKQTGIWITHIIHGANGIFAYILKKTCKIQPFMYRYICSIPGDSSLDLFIVLNVGSHQQPLSLGHVSPSQNGHQQNCQGGDFSGWASQGLMNPQTSCRIPYASSTITCGTLPSPQCFHWNPVKKQNKKQRSHKF